MKINMVRVEIIRNVRRLAGPGLRCFFLLSALPRSGARPHAIDAQQRPLPRERRRRDPHKRTPALYFKRLELVLRLRHVRLEEGERAELLDPVARVPIYRIVPFMDLDAA